jgi:hypothetical protein
MGESQSDGHQTSVPVGAKPIRKDESFYFVDVVFLVGAHVCYLSRIMLNVPSQVEGCLFKVPRAYFERDSEVFCSLFQLPVAQDLPIEGSSDQKPLHLEGVKEDDFRQLLKVMFPRYVILY